MSHSFPAASPAVPYFLDSHAPIPVPSTPSPSTHVSRINRKKSSPQTNTSTTSSSSHSSRQTPRQKTPLSTPRHTPSSTSPLNSRSSGRHNLSSSISSNHRPLHRDSPSDFTRPPLPPSSSLSSQFHHVPNHSIPVGVNKVRSRPQSAPPRSGNNSDRNLSYSLLSTSTSSGRRR
jgi:hypothetical protein